MTRLIASLLPLWVLLVSSSLPACELTLTPGREALVLDLLGGAPSFEVIQSSEEPEVDDAPPSSAQPPPTDRPEAALVGLSPAAPRQGLPYATQGSVAWWFETGAGTNFDGGWLVMGGVGVEWYPVDGFALGVRVDGVGIELDDTPTTGGGGGALVLRWHIYRAEEWSLYLDGGCGLVYFAEEVPSGASRLDFSPQVGGGITCSIASDVRLMAGLRWYHLSNAQTNSTNPGVDMLEAYVGVTFGF